MPSIFCYTVACMNHFLIIVLFSLFIRKRNQHFFMTGRIVVDLIEKYAKAMTATADNTPGRRNPRKNTAAIQQLELEATEVRRTLLVVSVVPTLSIH
jgi:hypothetical protein